MSLKKVLYNSIVKDGKPSSSRILAYVMMIQILLTGMTYIGIEIVNAIVAFKNKGEYTIPGQHIGVYALMLTHQLALLGIYKMNERSNRVDLNTQKPQEIKSEATDLSSPSEETATTDTVA